MIAEFLHDLIADFVMGAVHDTVFVEVRNDDGPGAVRVLALDTDSRIVLARLVERGDGVYVNRSFRLKVEPIDHVLLKPLCCVEKAWVMT